MPARAETASWLGSSRSCVLSLSCGLGSFAAICAGRDAALGSLPPLWRSCASLPERGTWPWCELLSCFLVLRAGLSAAAMVPAPSCTRSPGSSSGRFLELDEEGPCDLWGCSGSASPAPAPMDRPGRGNRFPLSPQPLVLARPVWACSSGSASSRCLELDEERPCDSMGLRFVVTSSSTSGQTGVRKPLSPFSPASRLGLAGASRGLRRLGRFLM